MEESDEALIGRYVRGDAPAFDQLYKRNEQRVWRYLERNVRNQAAADELLQEIWFALSRNAVSLESTTRFRTRLFTLTHDKMTNTLREQPLPEAPPLEGRPTRDPAGLAQVLAQLPREQREAFLLQAEGQLSVGEIAEITENTIDATQGSLRLAKLQLRELLGEGDVPSNPDDLSDVDQLYRRLSGVDPGKPGEWVRRKVQAYSAQQAAERSVRDSAKTREGAPAPAVAAPAATPRVTPAPAARVAPEPKQSGGKPWLLPVIGAVVVVALVGVFVVPSLRAPGPLSVPTPPPPPVAAPEPAPASQASNAPDSTPPPAPAAQAAEPEVASTPPPAPPPAQVAQSSPPPAPVEEPRSAPQPAAAPTTHAPAQAPAPAKAPARVAHQNAPTPPPSPPVAMNRTQTAPQAPVNNPAPAAPSAPVSAPPVAAAPPPPAQAVAVSSTPAPAPTPAAPAVASGPSAPPDDFYRAAESGDMGKLNEVLASNVDVNALDSKGRTALILAINRGHIDVVKDLLAHGADANKVDSHGISPRVAAHGRGSFEIQAAIDRAARH